MTTGDFFDKIAEHFAGGKTNTEKSLKKMKKVLDKLKTMCYYVKDAPRRRVRSMKSRTAFHIGCESGDVPCKLNNEKHEQTP
ncbi:MAG: hypothetical protein ACI4V3_09020, partial [Faecousia sp.]